MHQVNESSGRLDLIAAAKERKLSGAGSNPEILARIRAYDQQRARHAAEMATRAAADDDPLGLDDEPDPGVTPPETPPAAPGASPQDAAGGPGVEPADDGEPAGRTGLFGSTYRVEYPLGNREIDDPYHYHLIGETQAAAQAAGHHPKGGIGIGQRLGYGADANGRRTVVYEVPVRPAQG